MNVLQSESLIVPRVSTRPDGRRPAVDLAEAEEAEGRSALRPFGRPFGLDSAK